ncbi:hypothetical protein R8Z57_14655 [Microbacterium sp. M3]|uniref:MinD-like ATPase involved in chromosome partitioning or flagellar assembly n=1 Tax=Microbacterium arthrosphaerae TaxID=792652 RepID=A0ABU4H3V7_9MICO|nr:MULTISPECIES: hypothetical protein [Microbacterium]MDW4574018.1 hypothetical protein [Microbacterium arthrosphaerae]MDW7607873.1 hypothetical protein [Microbacterium sp. M3]
MSVAVRGIPAALFGSAVARRTALTEWDAAIRGILPTARRIGFVSLEPGVGTTTLALQVLRIIAARRSDPVLAVDVAGGGSDLAARLQLAATPADATRAGARTTAEALTGLPAGPGWYGLRPSTADGPVAAWLTEAAPITRFFDVTITDFGVRHPRVDLAACAAVSDVVCLVGDARRSPAELLRAIAPAVAALPESPTPVLALVDREGRGDAVARAMGDDPWPVVGIPADGGLRDGGQPRGQAGQHALLRLAATLVSAREAVAL